MRKNKTGRQRWNTDSRQRGNITRLYVMTERIFMIVLNYYCQSFSFFFKIFFGAFYAFIRTGQLKIGQETREREGE